MMDNQAEIETELTQEEMASQLVPQEIQKYVDEAKEKGLYPYWIMLNGFSFVYRPVTRKEWRDFSRDQNKEIAALSDDGDAHTAVRNKYTELLVKQCMIYSELPLDDNIGAGYYDTLFDAILVDSGFGQPDMPSIRL